MYTATHSDKNYTLVLSCNNSIQTLQIGIGYYLLKQTYLLQLCKSVYSVVIIDASLLALFP